MPSISIPAAIIGSTVIGAGVSMIGASNQADAATQGAQLQANSADRAAQLQADAANRAADLQNQATNRSLDITEKQYDTTRGDYAPWRDAGSAALKEQTNLLGLNGAGEQTNAFSRFRTDPGYEFTRDQAIQGIDRSAAARGLLTSGATIKAIQDRASSLADQGYSNYFNRFGVVAGTGQTATNSTAQLGAQAAANEGNALISGANARASGYNNAAAAGAAGINAGASALAGGYNNAAAAWGNGANGIGSSINSGLNNYFAYKGPSSFSNTNYSGDGNGEFYGLGGV